MKCRLMKQSVILRSLEIVEYVSTCSFEPGLFISGPMKQRWRSSDLITDTELFVTFVLMCDQGAGSATALTRLACSLLISSMRFPFMVIKARFTPVSIAEVASYSNHRG